MKPFLSTISRWFGHACNLFVGALCVGPIYLDPDVPEWEWPKYESMRINVDDILVILLILSILGLAFIQKKIAQQFFTSLAFVILLHNVYSALCYERYPIPLISEYPGRQIFISSTLYDFAIPWSAEKWDDIMAIKDYLRRPLESVALCLTWFVFNYWYFSLRDRKATTPA